jgi:hypothetical protein
LRKNVESFCFKYVGLFACDRRSDRGCNYVGISHISNAYKLRQGRGLPPTSDFAAMVFVNSILILVIIRRK